jgi:heme/copper-type cytochrome/quinol oxidase subunit 4
MFSETKDLDRNTFMKKFLKYNNMGFLRIMGFILIGIAIFLLIFIYKNSSRPELFLFCMVLPSLIVGILLVIAKEKSGYTP